MTRQIVFNVTPKVKNQSIDLGNKADLNSIFKIRLYVKTNKFSF